MYLKLWNILPEDILKKVSSQNSPRSVFHQNRFPLISSLLGHFVLLAWLFCNYPQEPICLLSVSESPDNFITHWPTATRFHRGIKDSKTLSSCNISNINYWLERGDQNLLSLRKAGKLSYFPFREAPASWHISTPVQCAGPVTVHLPAGRELGCCSVYVGWVGWEIAQMGKREVLLEWAAYRALLEGAWAIATEREGCHSKLHKELSIINSLPMNSVFPQCGIDCAICS